MIDREMQNADRGNRPPNYITRDEYIIWYLARGEETMAGSRVLEEHYNLEDALVITGFRNTFIRNSDVMKMANMVKLENVIAPIFTNENGMFKQTVYYPLQLFAKKYMELHLTCM